MPNGSTSLLRVTLGRFLRNPLTQRVIRNTGYLFSANTTSAALSMAQGVLAARLLGVEGLGLLGAITQFASVINRLTSFRMGELVVSYVGEFTAKGQDRHAAAVLKAAGMTEMASSVLAYGLVLALAPLGARYLAHDPATAALFAFYGLAVLANLMAESATGLLQILNQFRIIAAITVGQSVLTLGLIATVFFTKGGLSSVVLAYLVGKAAWGLAISGAAVWRASVHWGPGWWRAPLALLADRRRDMVRFAVSTNVSGSLNLVTRDSEILWLSAFSTPLQVGYYKVALAIMNILLIPVTPLISTTYREVAHEVAHRRWENVRYLLRSGTLIAAAWTLPAALGLVLFGRWVISLYGAAFQPAYVSLLILLVGVVVVNLFYWNRSVLLPLGMPEYPTKVSLGAAILKVAGVFLLVPTWGANGMAVMLSSFFFVTAGVLVWKTVRELRRASQAVTLASGA